MGKIITTFSNSMQSLLRKSDSLSSTSSLSIYKHDIIVFSHLRWEFVTQRPQHLMNRLSETSKVLFIEEPIAFKKEEEGSARVIQVSEQITVLQPRIPHEKLTNKLLPIIEKYCDEIGIQKPILWFYSPMFIEMAEVLDHELIVYDCMDELAAFLGAPPELVRNEKKLIGAADIVFTGGKSLFESKRRFHENVFCFPSSVDQKHFEKVFDTSLSIPQDLAAIPSPRVGFYGVIDERIDYQLIKRIAQQQPQVSFVLIGPVAKVDPKTLPKLANIYYLGEKKYADLPQYLKGFDIAMMPFALNKATQFISPTKTLEYMAAHKPIISTAIYDVQRDYQREVKIVKDAEQFTQAINEYLRESATPRARRVALQTAVIEKTSWDHTAAEMKKIIDKTIKQKESIQELVTEHVTSQLLQPGLGASALAT